MNHISSGSRRAFEFDLAALIPVFDRILNGSLHVTMNFQPIVDLRRGVVVGYEALVRFPAEIGLAPDVCFHAAEFCDRRLQLEDLVARKSLEAVEILPPDCFLSINISPAYVMSGFWEKLVAETTDFSRILFEITEQDPIDDYLVLRERIKTVLQRGGFIAVDDAGAGYASLKHAMELRPNFLKLDRYFVGECHTSYAKSTLVEMIGKAASRMDAWVVAEGIERIEELDELIRLSVPLGQGYFLGHPSTEMLPLPPDKALQIISRIRSLSEDRTLHPFTEPCAMTSLREDAELWPLQNRPLSSVAIIDPWGRPTDIYETHPDFGWRCLHNPMRVHQTAAIEEALHRALMRPRGQRFDILAVVDERGSFAGIVRIEKLIQAILHEKSSDPTATSTTTSTAPAAYPA